MKKQAPQSFAAAMQAARAKVVLSHPFFAVLLLNTPLVLSTEIDTAGVDGELLLMNEQFFMSLNEQERIGLLLHEMMHLALSHPFRMGSREAQRWNVACDYVINQHLVSGGVVLPPGALLDTKYDGMSAEQVYPLLPPTLTDSQKSAGGRGKVSKPKGSPQQMEAAEQKLKQTVAQAVAAGQAAGKLPDSMKRAVDDMLEPVVPWKQVLQRFLTEMIPSEPKWATPSRRFVSRGIYLPGTSKEPAAKSIVVGVDTSGSIGQKELDEFAAEISAIHKLIAPLRLHVIYCDAKVQHVDTFTKADDVTMAIHGGGGTEFAPVFEYVDDNGLNPQALVYLTDLYGPIPPAVPYPTLWVVYGNNDRAPWGETIHVR